MPDLSDQEKLPYISALTKELLRWTCPFPIGLPKRLTRDDIYNDHFIPSGATIVENVWAIFYNESIYPAPYTYDPERFLKDGKLDGSARDPEENVFGLGRRACPGNHFAKRTLFLNIACVLALFDIEAPAAEDFEAKFHEGGFVRQPLPFKCTIRPRSETSLKLLRSVSAGADY